MAVEGKMSIIKYLMFFFNLLFWISGIVLIVVGAYLRDKYGEYLTFADNKYSDAAIFLIIVGVVVFIIGFLGCCGAIKENYCMVTTFAVLLTIIFICELAAGILGFVYKGEVEGVANRTLHRGIDEYYLADKEGAVNFVDFVQRELHCCGYSNASDWNKKGGNTTTAPPPATTSAPTTTTMNVSTSNGSVTTTPAATTTVPPAKHGIPNSCCKNPPCTSTNSYKDGCHKKFETFLKDKLLVIGGVGVGIAFIQILGIVFACCLMRSIKGEYEVV